MVNIDKIHTVTGRTCETLHSKMSSGSNQEPWRCEVAMLPIAPPCQLSVIYAYLYSVSWICTLKSQTNCHGSTPAERVYGTCSPALFARSTYMRIYAASYTTGKLPCCSRLQPQRSVYVMKAEAR